MQECPPSLHFLAPHCPQHPPRTFLQWDPSPFQRWLLQPQTLWRPIRVCASRLLSLHPRRWRVPSVPHLASAGKLLLYPTSSKPWHIHWFLACSLIFFTAILTVKATAVRRTRHTTNHMTERRVRMRTAARSTAPQPPHPQIRKKESTVTAATASSLVMVG